MKNSTLILILVLVVLAAATFIGWPYIVKLFSKATGTTGAGDTTGVGTTADTAEATKKFPGLDVNLILQNGVKGPEVKQLQQLLNIYETNNPLVVDSIFGSKTEEKLFSITGKRAITLAYIYNTLMNGFK